MINNKTIIAITQGDINGIGYEVILKTLAEPRVYDDFVPVIYGSSKAAGFYRKQLDIQGLNLNIINTVEEAHAKKVNIINCTDEDIRVEPGKATEEAGKAAFAALERATADMQKGLVDALVTAPINKKNIQSAEFHFPGHTEYLEQVFGEKNSSLMLLVNDVMRVAVVTGHIPVKNIASVITKELILEKLKTLNQSLKQDFTVIRPRIAVLGLNPHAGDEGVIGDEEETIIKPALAEAQKEGLLCFGPYAADGFFGSGHFNKFDGILAMYHDQGLIPFKTVSMDSGVNYTAGLSAVRTSPAHGTAYDLAGQNLASEESFRQALFMAYDILQNRKLDQEIRSNPLKVEERRERGGRIA
ncbi:D-threonate 4-phosphate dehydrogenase [bioreactor metagenome]|jgi:4-hydroxythreonine-4-phosphate dehydrogenase|uniref:D-threonate 4-phosphate dehydrogenase n=1 Tax=bioreactor metagenome TaxID=1076179 RepID=A0A644VTR5_9ZZZZ|nr:4-hydroxythreonine-4-phosphate dehydrogenase PdxA [Paludibacter sp.]